MKGGSTPTSGRWLSAQLDVPLDLDPEHGMATEDLRLIAPWQDSWVNMVFVDGQFSSSLSSPAAPDGDTVGASIRRVLSNGGGPLQDHLGKYASVEDDGFIALNTAFLQDGACIEVPGGREFPMVLNLVYLTTDRSQPKATFPRTLILAGRSSRGNGHRELRQRSPRWLSHGCRHGNCPGRRGSGGALPPAERRLRELPRGQHPGISSKRQPVHVIRVLLWNGPWPETISR